MKKKFYGIIGSLMLLIACMFTIGVYASVTQKHDTEGNISYDPAIQESYLLKDWQNKLTNTGVDLSTLTSITFTQQKQDIPIGTIPISIGAKDKTGTTQFDQNANCYDISAYIKNTSLVFYSPKIIYAPEDCSYLFSNNASNKLSNLATLSLKNFDTSNTTKLDSIFKNCSNISTLDLSSLAINVGATTTDFFGGCTNLKTIQTPKTTNVAITLPTLTNKSFYKVSNLTSQTSISVSSSSFVLKVGALVTANPNGGTISNLNGWKNATNPTKVVLWDNNAIGTLPDATKTGHAIDGWYTSETAGTKVTPLTTFNQNSTIFAHWNANACAITYKLNGGTNASGNPTSYNYSESSQTISVNAPTKVGYDFAGWTVTNGSISGTTLTINAKADSVTLEAKWTASKYTITYKDQGDVAFSGTHASDYPTQHTYGTATTLKDATKTGYAFGGWFANKDCSGSAITTLGATSYTSAITLYAKWTKNNYNYTVTVPMTGTAQTVTITANGQSKTVNTNNGTATFAIPYGTKFTPSIKVAYTSGRYNLVWGSTATATRVTSGTSINRGSELTMTESGLSDTVKLTQLYFATADLSKNVGTDATYYIGTTNNPTTALTNSQEYYFLSNANITLYAKATFTSGKYNYTFGNAVATPVATGTVVNSGAFAPTYAGVTKTLTISQLYTLQAKANGNGTVTPASEIYVLRNGSASITATPTNATGYTTVFTNWAKTSGACTIASTSSANTTISAITSNTVVTATFTRTINSYTLTANANNGMIASTTGWTGSGESATKSVTYLTAYGTLPECTTDVMGMTFEGWYTEESGGTKVDASTVMSSSDVTIYAHYVTVTFQVYVFQDENTLQEVANYTVYDINGNSTSRASGSYISWNEILLLPTVENMLGWKVANIGETSFEFDIAKYGKSLDEVSMSLSEISGVNSQAFVNCTATDRIYLKNLASIGGQSFYVFPTVEVEEKTITFDAYFNNTSSSNGIVGLDEAVWSAFTNFATITVNGTTQMDGFLTDVNKYHAAMPANGTTVFSIGSLFSEGTLIDWINSIGLNGPNFNCSSARLFINQGYGDVEITSTTSDIRISKDAHIILRLYEGTVYTLVCNTNNGILVGSSLPNGWGATDDYSAFTQLIENTVIGEMPTATRAGYDFNGWYTTKDSDGTKVTSTGRMFSANTTLYARWSVKNITINYILYGGTNSDSNPTSFVYSASAQTVEIPGVPTRSGYKFLKWVVYGGTTNGRVDNTSTPAVLHVPAGRSETINLVAQWAKLYTVTFVDQWYYYNGTDRESKTCTIDFGNWSYEHYVSAEWDVSGLYEGATDLPVATLDGYQFLGWRWAGTSFDEVDIPVGGTFKTKANGDIESLYPVFERMDGYLSKNWKNSITNMSSVQSILFTSDSSKIPSGVTPVSVGAKQNGTDAWTSGCGTLDVKLYQSGASLVVYCAGNLCVVDARSMFSGVSFSSLTSLTLDNFDTSKVTSMADMFYGCSNLKTLNLSKFDTSNVTNMSDMFYNCKSLTTLNVTSFDTSKVTSMQGMFASCSSLTTLNVTNFNTSKVNYMISMFRGMSKLSSLNVSNFDTSNVTDFGMMFEECSSLTGLSLSNFVTTSATGMNSMFYKCSALTSLNLSNFDTSKVTSMYAMFSGCSKLQTLNISNFNIASGCNVTGMLTNCSSLKKINSPKINNKAIELPKTFYLNNAAVSQIAINTSGVSKVYSSTKN